MLQSHLNTIEKSLIALSKISRLSGHPVLQGNPREILIRDFLCSHLPSNLEIGQGAIIDVNSQLNQKKRQNDVIIYRRDFPKINLSKDDNVYFVEAVMATIEVKSYLNNNSFKSACETNKINKSLNRPPAVHGFIGGWIPPHILSYILAYDGPKNMETIVNWIQAIQGHDQFNAENMFDMIVVLGKGVLWRLEAFNGLGIVPQDPEHRWAYIQHENKNLFFMFSHMLSWFNATSLVINAQNYSEGAHFENVVTA